MIYLWDTANGRELRRFPTGHYWVEDVSFSPDGRLIASCGFDHVVRLWEAATGQERRHYDGHRNGVRSVEFDPDGRRLASASHDGTALVWHVFEAAPVQDSAADLEAIWADLTKDAKTAHRAAAALIVAKATPGFLKARLKPALKPTDEQITSWLHDLASPVFKKRDAAHKEIARAGDSIEIELQRALETISDAEVRRRLTALVANIPLLETRPEQLRDLRAVEVLGHRDDEAAHALLIELAKGAPDALLARQARASVALQKRKR